MRQPAKNERYTDKHGHSVTVERTEYNRVVFYRDGYESPCVQPLERFVREFTYLGGGKDD